MLRPWIVALAVAGVRTAADTNKPAVAATYDETTGSPVDHVPSAPNNQSNASSGVTDRCDYPCYCSESCGSWMWPLCPLDCPKCEPCTNNSTVPPNVTEKPTAHAPNNDLDKTQAHKHDHHKHADARHDDHKRSHAK